jgi:hypothetical protein
VNLLKRIWTSIQGIVGFVSDLFQLVLGGILSGLLPGLLIYGVISSVHILVLWISSGTFQSGQFLDPPGWLFRLSIVLGVILFIPGLKWGIDEWTLEKNREEWSRRTEQQRWDSLTDQEREEETRLKKRKSFTGCFIVMLLVFLMILLVTVDVILS